MANPRQTLQEFFDSPKALAARDNLSATAAETVSQAELLALEPGAADALMRLDLNYPERYAPAGLREMVAAKYDGIDADGVLITGGVDEALGLLMVTLVEAGDRVVVLTPCYPPHLELPRWRGGGAVAGAGGARLGSGPRRVARPDPRTDQAGHRHVPPEPHGVHARRRLSP